MHPAHFLFHFLFLTSQPLTNAAKPPPLPLPPFTAQTQNPYHCTNDTKPFIILGAGIAGLAAAHYLETHTRNCTIKILEQNSYPGGRIRTIRNGPFKGCEEGAGWIHEHTKNPISEIARAMKVETKWVGGDSTYVGGDKFKLFHASNGTALRPIEKERSYGLMKKLVQKLEEELQIYKLFPNIEMPILADRIIANTQHLSSADHRLLRWHLDLTFGGDWAAPIADLKLTALDEGVLAYEGGDSVFPNGFGQLPELIAEGLDIEYSCTVNEIDWSGENIIHLDHDINRVIRSESPSWNSDQYLRRVLQKGDIRFNPQLPSIKTNAVNNMKMAVLNRVYLEFPFAFWSLDTYTFGWIPSSSEGQWYYSKVISVCIAQGYEGRDGSANTLIIMIGGDSWEWASKQEHSVVIQEIISLLRKTWADVPDPLHYRFSDWASDPTSYGSYSYPSLNSTLQTIFDLAESVDDRLFWAGEATISGSARGTVHGAFLSGIREGIRMIHGSDVEGEKWWSGWNGIRGEQTHSHPHTQTHSTSIFTVQHDA